MEIKLMMRCNDSGALLDMFGDDGVRAGTQVNLADGITVTVERYQVREDTSGEIITLILAITQAVLATPSAVDVICNWLNKGKGHVTIRDEKREEIEITPERIRLLIVETHTEEKK